MDELVYVDETEFLYYLENFCRRESPKFQRAGDFITYWGRPSQYDDFPKSGILHGALTLKSDQILEKTSVHGSQFHESGNEDLPGVYRIKEKSAFSSMADGAFIPVVKTYRCVAAEQVRAKISDLNSDSVARQILRLRQRLESLQVKHAFAVKSDLEEFKNDFENLQRALMRRSLDQKSLYLLVVARSLQGALDLFVKERGDSAESTFENTLESFDKTYTSLATKIKARTKDRRTHRILISEAP